MYKYLLSALVAVAFIVASCADSNPPSGAPDNRPMVSDHKMTPLKTEFDRTLYNSCCEEYIEISGTLHLAYSEDGSHFRGNVSNLVGVGSNGNTYHGGVTESVFYEDYGYDMHVVSWVMTSVGGECKFKLKIVFHVVDDEIVVDKYEIECVD